MTITFYYYQYLNYYALVYITIPSIITAIFTVVLNIFILVSSRELREEIEKVRLLMGAAIINIIFSILPFTFPMVGYASPTEIERIIIASYLTLLGLAGSLPFFISYGLFFFLFGKANQERYNSFLKIAGILWMVSFGFSSIILNGWLDDIIYIFTGSPPTFVITYWTRLLFIIIELSGFVLLLIHGIKNKNKNLMIAGILRLVAFITVFFYPFFADYFYNIYI
ncbi:MAG: hypothetical protein ACFFC1_05660 [Promethearchaeota archaeon]